MITNFEHMKKWKEIYAKLTRGEDRLLEAEEQRKKSTGRLSADEEEAVKLTYEEALSSWRRALESFLKELVKEAHISDETILQIKKAEGKGEGGVNIFGMILALEKLGVISNESASNLHFIRENGNRAAHIGKSFRTAGEAAGAALQVYPRIYRETYLFANQYVPNVRAKIKNSRAAAGSQTAPNVQTANGTAAGNKKTGGVIAIVLIAIVIIMFLFFMGSIW